MYQHFPRYGLCIGKSRTIKYFISDYFQQKYWSILVRCTIWYHLYNFKNVNNTNEGVLILVKLQAFTKINTPPWVFFTFFKLYKWYQIAQRITNNILQFSLFILLFGVTLHNISAYLKITKWNFKIFRKVELSADF